MPKLLETPAEGAGFKAERRNLTILFCDLVGSSALATRLDPEDLREALHAFQAACARSIQRYEGHVARYMGDGVLAYFGFPGAHEDDAERAVDAALELIAAVSDLSLPGVPKLQVRIGIATGLVVVGDLIGEGPSSEFAVVGEAPNLAASLQQSAEPNQILMSPSTRRLLGQKFALIDLGERRLKGNAEPLRVWSVVGPSTVQSRFDAHHFAQLTPFAGRGEELAVIGERFQQALQGKGQVVAISGEPGIGKSRLILAFRASVSEAGARMLLFQCSSYHTSSPLYPVIRHLEDAAGISHDTPPEAKLEKLESLVDQYLEGERESAVPLLAELLSIRIDGRYRPLELTPQQQKKRTFAVLLALVRAQAERKPLILVHEDVHWGDPTSLELLDLLQQEIKTRRILVILSYRPEFQIAWRDQPHVTPITLGRLEREHVSGMVDALAQGAVLPDAVIEQIVAKTDGVPLFVEEVTKAVLEDRRASEVRLAAGLQWMPAIPDTLHDSLMARLDQLASMKAIAQIAAAIGREFALDLLEAVATVPLQDIEAAVDRLIASGLLFRRAQATHDVFVFKHALVQETAYSSMLRDERRNLHVRIADALCRQFNEIVESAPEIAAHHYTQAGETQQAIGYWLKAGQQASRRSAFVEATTHMQAALKLLGNLPEGTARDQIELQIQQSLAMAFIAVRGFGATETTQALERALFLCERLNSPPQIFAVLNGLVGVHYMRGQFEQARSVAEDLLARARQHNDTTALLMGHRVLGMAQFAVGELEEARRNLQSALDFYEPSRHAPLALVFSQDFKATAQVYLGLVLVLAGDIERGLIHARDALAYAEHLRHPHSICYVLPFLAGAHLVAGMPQAAYPIAERTVTLSSEYGFPQWLAGGLLLRGWARLDLGEVESGLADIRRSIGGLQATGTLIWMQFAHFQLARGLTKADERGEAVTVVDAILQDMATGSRWYEAEVHRLKGDLLLSAGNTSEAQTCYETARRVAMAQGARLWALRATTALLSLRRDDGQRLDPRGLLAPLAQAILGDCPDLRAARALLDGTSPAV